MRLAPTTLPVLRSHIHGVVALGPSLGSPSHAWIASSSVSCSLSTRPRLPFGPKHSGYVLRPLSGVSHSTAYRFISQTLKASSLSARQRAVQHLGHWMWG